MTTGCPATIYRVKTGRYSLHTDVNVEHALVTGVGTTGFFVQVKEPDMGYTTADNSGLFVFTTLPATVGSASRSTARSRRSRARPSSRPAP